jgi:hypothetical protein
VLPRKENWDNYLEKRQDVATELEQVDGFIDNVRYKSLSRHNLRASEPRFNRQVTMAMQEEPGAIKPVGTSRSVEIKSAFESCSVRPCFVTIKS